MAPCAHSRRPTPAVSNTTSDSIPATGSTGMISGIRKVAASIGISLLLSAPMLLRATPPDGALDPAQLVATLKRSVPARTAYVEVRYSGLLERPLILRGEMEYLGPGRLAKRVDAPYHEQTAIADGRASLRRGDKPERSLPLTQIPELDSFLRGFSALLGGDAAALARDFALTASGSSTRWQLLLKPRDARLARRVTSLRVDGSGSEPWCFRTEDADGDVGFLLVGPLAASTLSPRVSSMQVDALCRGIARK